MSNIDPNKKTVYHSALVQAGEIIAEIKSEPTKSKFKKDGQDQFYIVASIAGNEHQLTIENDRCREALAGFKGQMVKLKAEGSRDDAYIYVSPMGGQTKQSAPAPQAPNPQMQSTGQHGALMRQEPQSEAPTGNTCTKEVKQSIMQIANLHLQCMIAVAKYEAPAYKKATGLDMSESAMQAATASLFIKADRLNLHTQMPHGAML